MRPEKLKPETPFVKIPSEDGICFQAVFSLPDDGTGSNLLIIRCEMDSDASESCCVSIIGKTQVRETHIMRCDSVPIKSLANILYGFARIKTKEYLEFN